MKRFGGNNTLRVSRAHHIAQQCGADPGPFQTVFLTAPGSAMQRCTLHRVRGTRGSISTWRV